jgi:hypothetical protein
MINVGKRFRLLNALLEALAVFETTVEIALFPAVEP